MQSLLSIFFKYTVQSIVFTPVKKLTKIKLLVRTNHSHQTIKFKAFQKKKRTKKKVKRHPRRKGSNRWQRYKSATTQRQSGAAGGGGGGGNPSTCHLSTATLSSYPRCRLPQIPTSLAPPPRRHLWGAKPNTPEVMQFRPKIWLPPDYCYEAPPPPSFIFILNPDEYFIVIERVFLFELD